MTGSNLPATQPGTPPAIKAPGGVVNAIVPQTLAEVSMMANMVAKAGWAPNSYRKDVPRNAAGGRVGRPEDQDFDTDKIAIGILQGLEVGLKPVQALQSIAVINGIPAVYGDAMLAVVYSTGQVEDFAEVPILKDGTGEVIGWTATMKRKGRPTPTVRSFTVEDAKSASLLDKAGPWKQYRSRMLQMRARAICLRDSFADALKGLMAVEEAQDVQVVSNVPLPAPTPPKGVTGKLGAFAGEEQASEPAQQAQEGVQDAQFEEPGADGADGSTDAPSGDQGGTAFNPAIPDGIKADFDKQAYTPFLQWVAAQCDLLQGDVAAIQEFADAQMARLQEVAKSSAKAKLVVERMASDKGFELLDMGGGD